MLRLFVIPAAVGLAVSAQTESYQASPYERFQLFNNCRPMRLHVSSLGAAADIGLTEARIQTLAESRLRAARLYDAWKTSYEDIRSGKAEERIYDPSLKVTIEAFSRTNRGGAVSLKVQFRKVLQDPISGRDGVATTWERGSYGTYSGDDTDFVMQHLSELVDEFVLEYLRLNEPACAP